MEDNNNMTLPLEEADNNITESPVSSVEYTDDNIRHLDDMEHIRCLLYTSPSPRD